MGKSIHIENLFFKDSSDLNKINNCLDENGLAIIKNYLNNEELLELNKEFSAFIETKDEPYKIKTPYSEGIAIRVDRLKLDDSKYPLTAKVFSSKFMERVADHYLEDPAEINEEIFVVKDVVGSKHIANDMHFDVVPTLKFFIYLTDTTAKNGAFTCVPTSHLRTAEIRDKYRSQISDKNIHLSREIPYEESEVIPIEGKAGTLIIFTTETFHKAGEVSEGERLVMRGHSRSKKHTKNKSIFKKLIQRLKNH